MKHTQQQVETWKTNRKLDSTTVINQLPVQAKSNAFIVGAWVWLEFDQFPDKETVEKIKTLGFKWNRDRKVYQHPCGVFSSKNPKIDPRIKYGCVPVEDSHIDKA